MDEYNSDLNNNELKEINTKKSIDLKKATRSKKINFLYFTSLFVILQFKGNTVYQTPVVGLL